MGKIKQILLQDKAGVSQRQIARNLGVNRETVGKYIKSAKADAKGVDGLLGLDELELERRLNGGVAGYSDKRHNELASLLPGIEDEMRRGHKRGVTVKLVGNRVRFVYTRSLVKIHHVGRCVATHRRDLSQGKYTIDPAHLPTAYRSRNVEYYISRAAAILPELGEMVELLYDTTNQAEQTLYKNCDAILHLAREPPPRETLLRACRSALAYGRYYYGHFKGFVAAASSHATVEPLPPPPEHENIRGSGYYS